jgi:hypothetical protein
MISFAWSSDKVKCFVMQCSYTTELVTTLQGLFAIFLNTYATGNDNLESNQFSIPSAGATRCDNKQTSSQAREHNKVGRSLRAIHSSSFCSRTPCRAAASVYASKKVHLRLLPAHAAKEIAP